MNNTILQFKMSVYIQVFKKQTALAFFLEMPIFLLNSRKHAQQVCEKMFELITPKDTTKKKHESLLAHKLSSREDIL